MTTTTILDEAESRLTPTATTAQTVRQEQLAAMYLEIGRPLLDQAKVELPKLEHFIAKDSRPFVARVASIGQRAQKPLPHYVQAWLTEMVLLADSTPNTIRSGIEGYAKLSVPIWTDGKTLDINERARLIAQLRFCLRNWDGVQSRLTNLRAYVEQYIRESNWPAVSASAGAPPAA
jgi:hypothetical protein